MSNLNLNWFSPKMTLTKDWQTYDIDLKASTPFGGQFAAVAPDYANSVSFVLDSNTNGVDEKGTVEIGPLRFH